MIGVSVSVKDECLKACLEGCWKWWCVWSVLSELYQRSDLVLSREDDMAASKVLVENIVQVSAFLERVILRPQDRAVYWPS